MCQKAQPSMNRVNGMLVLTIVDRDIRVQIISITAASVWEYAFKNMKHEGEFPKSFT